MCKTAHSNLHVVGNVFAENLIPQRIDFIMNDKFVIVETKAAYIYQIREDGIVTEMISNIKTKTAIIAALPTGNRHQLAILEESGNVGFFDY